MEFALNNIIFVFFENIEILFPKQDDDVTPDSQPRLRGKAIPLSQISITIKSLPQTATITTDRNGIWTFRPSKELSPGIHTVTIQGFDRNGSLFTQTRRFIVLKSGERVLGESTPSASLTPTNQPTLTITPKPTTSLPPTPTTSYLPSQPPNISPPRSGNSQTIIIFLGMGITLVILGINILKKF